MKCGYRLCPRCDAIPRIRIFFNPHLFFFFSDTVSVHTYPVNPSGIRIRNSPEWKFLNTLWIRKYVDARSGIFLCGDVKKSSPVLYRERQRKIQISRALRRMLCCQYSQRCPVNRFEYVYLWTWNFFLSGSKKLWIQKYQDTCWRGLNVMFGRNYQAQKTLPFGSFPPQKLLILLGSFSKLR